MKASEELKLKRQAILAQIDQWEPKRCPVCVHSQANRQEVNCLCEAAVEIRKLGDAYSALSRISRDERINRVWRQVFDEGLEIGTYLQLKEEHLIDNEIRKCLGWSNNRFFNWKQEQGLSRTQRLA